MPSSDRCACPSCPWVEYMNNRCGHSAVSSRSLDWPGRETSHFPRMTPEWCPAEEEKRQALARLEAELQATQDERNAQYWRFTRQSRGQPVSREIHQKIHALQEQIKAVRAAIRAK